MKYSQNFGKNNAYTTAYTAPLFSSPYSARDCRGPFLLVVVFMANIANGGAEKEDFEHLSIVRVSIRTCIEPASTMRISKALRK